jgi:beta-1,4-mannosyl-glycoprotein beta-1,4-N-acetylglucosaminyltransferase
MKIIDCFPFFNELTVLDIRLNTLYDVVDKFVLIEATKSHQNLDKPLYFEQNKERFSKFADKIVHVVLDEYPPFNYWSFEHNQRNYIVKAIERLNLEENDVVFVSDCDEIWNPDLVNYLPELEQELIYFWPSHVTYRYFNAVAETETWYQPFFLKYSLLNKLCVDMGLSLTHDIMRSNYNNLNRKLNSPSGWHFSYTEDIKYKLQNFVHSEHRDLDEKHFLDSLINKGINPFFANQPIYKINKEECIQTLPKYVQQNLSKFQNYLL